MCCEALKRGRGQLVDINIVYFGNEQLLYRIEGKQLRHLAMAYQASVWLNELQTFHCWSREELHLLDMESKVSAGNVETIGRACSILNHSRLMRKHTVWFC